MATVYIPSLMQPLTGGLSKVDVVGSSVRRDVDEWSTDLAAMGNHFLEARHNLLPVIRKRVIGAGPAFGDGIDHVDDDERGLLWVQFNSVGHDDPPDKSSVSLGAIRLGAGQEFAAAV